MTEDSSQRTLLERIPWLRILVYAYLVIMAFVLWGVLFQ